MITYLVAAMTVSVVITVYSLGPMKLSVNLLVLSLIIMCLMTVTTGSSWFPLIFVLLFAGGILMVFIILASFLPNEKSKKMKILTGFTILPVTASIAHMKFLGDDKIPDMVKCALTSGMGAVVIISIMLLYFVMFLEIIYSDSLPMRSCLCQKNTVL